MDDGGIDDPTLAGVASVQSMYATTITVRFHSQAARIEAQRLTGWELWDETTLEIRTAGVLIETKEPDRNDTPAFYADFFLVDDASLLKKTSLRLGLAIDELSRIASSMR